MNDDETRANRSFTAKLVHGGAFTGALEVLRVVRILAAVAHKDRARRRM